jgi:hypothetical protein
MEVLVNGNEMKKSHAFVRLLRKSRLVAVFAIVLVKGKALRT